MAKVKSNLIAKSSRNSSSLTHYDPQRGVKQIAVAAMREKHYAQAKDATQLVEAIRDKLTRQAEFVLWWDTQVEKAQGRRNDKGLRNRSDTKFQAGEDGLPDRMTISRWRRKLNDPEKFEQAFEAICARYPKLLEFDTTAHVGRNTGAQEWYTPVEIIKAARSVLGDIDLDPATSPEANVIVKAAQIFTHDDDGLAQAWHGRVWMNPPYAQPLVQQFSEKLVHGFVLGEISAAIVLVNNATETAFFQTLARASAAICFPQGRVRFWNPSEATAAPLQGQAILYFGVDAPAFVQAFESFGFVAEIRHA